MLPVHATPRGCGVNIGSGRNRAAKTISCTSAHRTHVLHQAGLRADEQECILAELPSRDYRSGFGPEVGPIIRFSSITVAGAAPDWSKNISTHRLPVIPNL